MKILLASCLLTILVNSKIISAGPLVPVGSAALGSSSSNPSIGANPTGGPPNAATAVKFSTGTVYSPPADLKPIGKTEQSPNSIGRRDSTTKDPNVIQLTYVDHPGASQQPPESPQSTQIAKRDLAKPSTTTAVSSTATSTALSHAQILQKCEGGSCCKMYINSRSISAAEFDNMLGSGSSKKNFSQSNCCVGLPLPDPNTMKDPTCYYNDDGKGTERSLFGPGQTGLNLSGHDKKILAIVLGSVLGTTALLGLSFIGFCIVQVNKAFDS